MRTYWKEKTHRNLNNKFYANTKRLASRKWAYNRNEMKKKTVPIAAERHIKSHNVATTMAAQLVMPNAQSPTQNIKKNVIAILIDRRQTREN
jgi:hypothetical protein